MSCSLCGGNVPLNGECGCLEMLDDHASSCAVQACCRGLWNGYDGYCTRDEWLSAGARPEDLRHLVEYAGAVTREQVHYWRQCWHRTAIRWVDPPTEQDEIDLGDEDAS